MMSIEKEPKKQSTVYPKNPARNYSEWCQWMIQRYKNEWKNRINNKQ